MRKARNRLVGVTAVYRCGSRIFSHQIVLDMMGREKLVETLHDLAAFSSVEIITYCVMPHHFELLVRVPGKVELTDSALLKRLTALYGEKSIPATLARRSIGTQGQIPQKLRKTLMRRMGDISVFMKELKQRFSRWYGTYSDHSGVLWAERFKSVLVEDAPVALQTAAVNIDLHPVRAGLVQDPKDYRFGSYAAALAGNKSSQGGLTKLVQKRDWPSAAAAYRSLLFPPNSPPNSETGSQPKSQAKAKAKSNFQSDSNSKLKSRTESHHRITHKK